MVTHTHTHRIAEAHSRHLRKVGGGNESEGVRILAERDMLGFVERRRGPADRRQKRK